MTWKTGCLAFAALLLAAACSDLEDATVAESAASAAPAAAAPSPGDEEYARLTASWSDEAMESCARPLRETLGTRDLVQGALDGVSDPEGKATAELEDARHWKTLGDEKVASIQPLLESGTCGADVPLALDEAVQFYVKAGTSAVQAGQIAGS